MRRILLLADTRDAVADPVDVLLLQVGPVQHPGHPDKLPARVPLDAVVQGDDDDAAAVRASTAERYRRTGRGPNIT